MLQLTVRAGPARRPVGAPPLPTGQRVFLSCRCSYAGQSMNSNPESAAHLQQVVADLVRTAEANLPPPEKLDLLCVQIGTAQYWLDQLQRPVDLGPELTGPHFIAHPQLSPISRIRPSQFDV